MPPPQANGQRAIRASLTGEEGEQMVREVVSSGDTIKHFPNDFGITRQGSFFRRAQPRPFARNVRLRKWHGQVSALAAALSQGAEKQRER